jgi:predicted ATPase
MLKGIVVENYRVFEDEIEFELTPLTILTGPNNSGKSSVLNVIDILNYIFNERDSLRKLVNNGISEKIFVERFGGFENLISQNSGKDDIKLGFLWYSKQIRTDLKYHFTFSKNRKLLSYSIEEKFEGKTIKIVEFINEVENLTDSSIQINFTRLNELIYALYVRRKIALEACIKLVKEIKNKFGSETERLVLNYKYDKYYLIAKEKFKEILKGKNKIKFEYIRNFNQIKERNEIIYITYDFHKITKREFDNYFKDINEIYKLYDVVNGTIYNNNNLLIDHLKQFDKCTIQYVNETGNTYTIIDNINRQLYLILNYIEEKELQSYLENEVDELKTKILDPIIKKYKIKNDIDIELELSDNLNQTNGINNFDEDEGLFKFTFYDDIFNKNNVLTEEDIYKYLEDDNAEIDLTDNFLGIDLINIDLNELERNYLNNILNKYFPLKYEESSFVSNILFSNIFFELISKIKFESDHYDFTFFSGLFSSLNESNSKLYFEDVLNINLGSIYDIGNFIFGIDIQEFIKQIKIINLKKYKKLFNKNNLLNYADKLLNHNLKNQLNDKEKCFLVEIFIFLFKKNVTNDTLNNNDYENLKRGIIKDLNAYLNSNKSNKFSEYQGTHFTILNNFIREYCLEFKWINEDLTNSFISHNANITVSRNNHFQMENELSKLMNIYAFNEEKFVVEFGNDENYLSEKKYVLEILRKYLKTFDIAEDVEIEVIKNINTFNIYLISKGRKTLLQDNGYGIIQIFSTLLFFALSNNPNTHYRNLFTYRYIIKEPESNLHPALQSKLGNIFSNYIKYDYTNNRKLLIETHSEYLIRKIQTLVAKKELDKDKVIIYYISQKQNLSKDESLVKKININERGVMSEPFGPGFFDESDSIVGELLEIRLNQKN